ncbi:MAG: hypothetical protein ABFD65_13935 [Candidatus Polarisedimenticolia bacterium]
MTDRLKSYDKLFHEIDAASVVLAGKGVYRQAKLYRRYDGAEHQLFARWGGGFIRLQGQSGTSLPHVRWLDLDIDGGALATGRFGAPVLNPREAGSTA